MSCGADTEANALMASLLLGEDITIPSFDLGEITFPDTVDLSALVIKLTNADLTTKAVGGTGTFDVLMASVKAHLKEEYDSGRITGSEYTRAYIELTSAVMGNATQFLLGRDKVYWEGQLSQIQALIARVQFETTKVQAAQAQLEANTVRVNFAKTKIQLAGEDMQYCTLKYNLENIQPAQLSLLQEQKEVQRAQTMNTRSDGATIVGVLGKQKDLYTQQITSYVRDAETKAAKIISDVWITQKTMDEGLTAPVIFQNTETNTIITKLMQNVNLT